MASHPMAAVAKIKVMTKFKTEWFFISTVKQSTASHGLRQVHSYGIEWRHDFCYTISDV